MTDRPIALETRETSGARLFSPSAARNRDAIREAFDATMPRARRVLEIGSGTGEHVVHLAAAFSDAHFHPGDPDAASRASIAAWTEHYGLANVAPPHALDAASPGWEIGAPSSLDGVLAINMIHIAPFTAAQGLVRGASALLSAGGVLFLYGPFRREGAHTAPSNAEFDASLRTRNPAWGVRDLEREIEPLARGHGFVREAVVAMPANNFSVVFRRL